MNHEFNRNTAVWFQDAMRKQCSEHLEIGARIRAANAAEDKTGNLAELLEKGTNVPSFGNLVIWQQQERTYRKIIVGCDPASDTPDFTLLEIEDNAAKYLTPPELHAIGYTPPMEIPKTGQEKHRKRRKVNMSLSKSAQKALDARTPLVGPIGSPDAHDAQGNQYDLKTTPKPEESIPQMIRRELKEHGRAENLRHVLEGYARKLGVSPKTKVIEMYALIEKDLATFQDWFDGHYPAKEGSKP